MIHIIEYCSKVYIQSTRGVLLALLATLLLAACDKLPVNGDLDGQWHLLSIQTPSAQRDLRDSLVFLSIQLQLAQWNDRAHSRQYYSHFVHSGDSIFFSGFAHTSAHTLESNNDEWATAAEMSRGLMDAWGIHSTDARFRVLRLTDSDLQLQQADTLLLFRKF